jgi:hypothetical protein
MMGAYLLTYRIEIIQRQFSEYIDETDGEEVSKTPNNH